MARDDALHAEGSIIEALPKLKFRVELSNGHRLMGFVVGKERASIGQLGVGDKVNLEMSPYDLSRGRIISKIRKSGKRK